MALNSESHKLHLSFDRRVLDKYESLELKKVILRTPLGDLTRKELGEKFKELGKQVLPYGVYLSHDDFLSTVFFWHTPVFTEEGCANLRWCIRRSRDGH